MTARSSVPASSFRHLADADIERIVFEGPSRVIDVGVRRRFFTGALRRAIEVRDRHCTHPSGCDVPAEQCEIDHIEPYSRGGLTTQANGRCRCSVHNRQRSNRPDAPDDLTTGSRSLLRQHHEVVAVDDFVHDTVRKVRGVAAGDRREHV